MSSSHGGLLLKPNASAWRTRVTAPILTAACAKYVFTELASAVSSVIGPNEPPSKLVTGALPMTSAAGPLEHASSAVSAPLLRPAVVVTILNVEPGA